MLERTTHWALANVDPDASASAAIGEQKEGLARLREEFPGVVAGDDRILFETRIQELQALGVQRPLAQRLITLRFLPQLLDVLRIAREGGYEAVETARAYYLVSERFGCAALRAALRATASDERWEKRLVEGLVEDLGRAHRSLARSVLACMARGGSEPGKENGDAEDCLAAVAEAHPRQMAAYWEILEELEEADGATPAGYAVAIRLLRDIAPR